MFKNVPNYPLSQVTLGCARSMHNMALSLLTKDRHGYSVAFSPYYGNKLAVATSQHFGIAGKILCRVTLIQNSGFPHLLENLEKLGKIMEFCKK